MRRIYTRATNGTFTPDQVAHAYNFPTGVDCSDVTIYYTEFGGEDNKLAIYAYDKENGLVLKSLNDVLVDGATEVPDPTGADMELDLDLEVGVANNVNQMVVLGPNSEQGFIDVFAKCLALSKKGDVVSVSWGGPENSWSQASMDAINNLFGQLVANGVNVFCASGDNGSSDGTTGTTVDFPASAPNCIACGGTTLSVDSTGARSSETAWSLASDGSGSGGGISAYFPKPAYQQNVMPGATGRCVPDISGVANPNTGFNISTDGVPAVVGGTSDVAPTMAKLSALLFAKTRIVPDFHSIAYNMAGACYDVTQGSNGAYSCQVGYDCVTGMGVPDGNKFLVAMGQPLPVPPQAKKSLWQKILGFFNL